MANPVELELLQGKAGERVFAEPVLLLHGAGFSAACWQGFLDYFAAAGCDAYAVSLRGHGASAQGGSVVMTGSDAYVEDIRWAVERVGGSPVLVGHSWGGYLLQRYLEKYDDCARAVLMASAPASTSAPAYWGMFKKFPWLVTVAHLTARPHYVYSTAESVRELLFYDAMSANEIRAAMDEIERISTLLYLQTIFRPPKADRIQTDMLVMGGGVDVIYPPEMIAATAKVYGVEPVMIAGACHMMMLDPTWKDSADAILRWLDLA